VSPMLKFNGDRAERATMQNYNAKVDGKVVARGIGMNELSSLDSVLHRSNNGYAILFDADTGAEVGTHCAKRGYRGKDTVL
jgi:hypothetical protein